jgi:L-fuconolactonase
MKPLRIDAHQHFWRYRADDYPRIGKGMELLACDRLPGQLHPVLDAEGLPRRSPCRPAPGAMRPVSCWTWPGPIAALPGWWAGDLSSPHLAANVAQWGRDKLVGFRHQVQDEADVTAFLEAPAFNAGIKWPQQQGLVYDVLVYARQMPRCRRSARAMTPTGWCWITWASRPWLTSAQ